jgi:hypothetical protein
LFGRPGRIKLYLFTLSLINECVKHSFT